MVEKSDFMISGFGSRPDLRVGMREKGDRLLSRAIYLRKEDRVLITNLFEHGLPVGNLAVMFGVCPQTIRRRAQRLCRHLNSELFTFILIHRSNWSRSRRRIAELRFLQKCTLRETVERSGFSLHQVRRHSQAVLEQFQSLRP